MEVQKVVARLNREFGRELMLAIRYLLQSFALIEQHDGPTVEFLRLKARESMDHATLIGDQITALGGTPAVRIAEILQPEGDTREQRLEEILDAEREGLEDLEEFLVRIRKNVGLRTLIELLMDEERTHVKQLKERLHDW